MNNQSPSKEVSYFNHFPHALLKPYTAQVKITDNAEMVQKLTVKNCEWFLRPKIAISEASQAILENLQTVQESTVFNEDITQSVHTKLNGILQSLQNLNSQDKTTQPSTTDIFQLMQFAVDGDVEFDNLLSEVIECSSSMYVMAIQIKAIRALMANPEAFAAKMVCDDQPAVTFRNQKTLSALQQMLNTMCVPATNLYRQTVSRNLTSQLVNPATGSLPQPSVSTITTPTDGLTNPQTTLTQNTVPPGLTNPQTTVAPNTVPVVPNADIMQMMVQMQLQMQQMRELHQQSTHTSTSQANTLHGETSQESPRKRKNNKKTTQDPLQQLVASQDEVQPVQETQEETPRKKNKEDQKE